MFSVQVSSNSGVYGSDGFVSLFIVFGLIFSGIVGMCCSSVVCGNGSSKVISSIGNNYQL